MAIEVAEAMRGAVRCDPDHVQSREVLGLLLMRAGQFAEAEKNLRLVMQLDPQNQSANRLLQQVLKKAKSVP